MASLKEFIKSYKDNKNGLSLPSPSSKELTNVISKEIKTNSAASLSISALSSSDTEKFSSQMAELANSDTVLTELSNSLGVPKEHESEDEFVERAKSIFKNILSKKMTD